MNRRSFLFRVAATAISVPLAPLVGAGIVRLPNSAPIVFRNAARGATLTTYDDILKKHYAPMIMRELNQRSSLLRWLDKDGSVLRNTRDGYTATFRWIESFAPDPELALQGDSLEEAE